MEIKIRLSPEVLKLVMMYGILTDQRKADIEDIVSQLIDLEGTLKTKIAEGMGFIPSFEQPEPAQAKPAATKRREVDFSDVTGIGDGLGDDDPEPMTESSQPAGLRKADALVPSTGGVKDEDIDRDMDVDDPTHESKAEATFTDFVRNKQAKAEDVFAEVAGLPPVNVQDDPPARPTPQQRRRRNPNARRAKVTPLTHEPRDV